MLGPSKGGRGTDVLRDLILGRRVPVAHARAGAFLCDKIRCAQSSPNQVAGHTPTNIMRYMAVAKSIWSYLDALSNSRKQ